MGEDEEYYIGFELEFSDWTNVFKKTYFPSFVHQKGLEAMTP